MATMAAEIKQLIVGSLSTNCYLLISGNELVIIDPGDESGKILREIRKTQAKPTYIINTHHHPDHISANQRIKEETGAKILIHPVRSNPAERDAVPPLAERTSNGVHQTEKSFIDFPVDQFLEEGDEIKVGETILKVIHTPGHTRGSICLLGENFLFTGDTLFNDGFGRTDLPGGSMKEMQSSLQKLSKFIKPGMIIYPGHGEIFTSK